MCFGISLRKGEVKIYNGKEEYNIPKRLHCFGKIIGGILWTSIILSCFELFVMYNYVFIIIIKYLFGAVILGTFLSFISLIWRKENIFSNFVYIFWFYMGFFFIFELLNLILNSITYIKKLIKFPEMTIVKIFFLIFTIISYVSIFKSNHFYVLYSSVIILIGSIYVACYLLFLWITSPLILVKWTYEICEKSWNWLLKNIKRKKDEVYKDDSFLKFLNFIERFVVDIIGNKYIGNLSKKVNMKNVLISRFLGLFIITLVFIIVSFSLQYYALYKIDPGNITGIGNTYMDFLFFSITNFLNINFKVISVNMKLAKFLIVGEVYLTLYFFTLIIFAFTSITESAAKARIEQAKEVILSIKTDVKGMKKELKKEGEHKKSVDS